MKLLPIFVMLFINIVYCDKWSDEFAKKIKEVDVLSKDMELLQAKLSNSTSVYSATNVTMKNMKKKIEDIPDEIKDKMAPFHVSYTKKVSDAMKSSEAAYEKYARNESVNLRYNIRFTKIIKAFATYEARYDNDNKWLTDTLKKTSDKLDEGLSKFKNEVKIPVEEKLKKLQGKLTEEERKKKLKDIQELQDDFYKINRQIQSNEFHEEEKGRSDGNSGIKQIRAFTAGGKNYHSNTHTGGSFAAIHDHSNNIRTVGMGEFIGVLNGIEFRTRHNDYRLNTPVNNDKYFHRTTPVPFPDVPPEVLNAGDVDAQAVEMREWFKAFRDQNHTVRDYRKYFKAHITYLEGAWQLGKAGDSIDEPFESDRHHIDANSWFDLQEKVRYTSYTGTKSLLENLANLPTKFIRFTDDKRPVLAQWNYRILCHPIEGDVPLKTFKLVLDPATQLKNGQNDEKYENSRAAKFEIDGVNVNGEREENAMTYNFLDKIMEQIPGKDNYGAEIDAIPFGAEDDKLYSANPNAIPKRKLNAAYYHRAYLQQDKFGKRIQYGQRGFSDRLFVSHTTQDRIAHVSYNVTRNGKSERINTKVSYAVPVEIIYLTPLSKWNPYNLQKSDDNTGSGTFADPFPGLKSTRHYVTPEIFFSGEEKDTDPADTAKKGGLFIKSSNGPKAVRGAGIRIFLPGIKGVTGNIRQRYPIMPIHGEGSAVWKKINAIRDAIAIHNPVKNENKYFSTGVSHSSKVTGHTHIIEISNEDYAKLMAGEMKTLKVTAQTANAHVHELVIGKKDGKLYIADCDGSWVKDNVNHPDQVCIDYHENTLSD